MDGSVQSMRTHRKGPFGYDLVVATVLLMITIASILLAGVTLGALRPTDSGSMVTSGEKVPPSAPSSTTFATTTPASPPSRGVVVARSGLVTRDPLTTGNTSDWVAQQDRISSEIENSSGLYLGVRLPPWLGSTLVST